MKLRNYIFRRDNQSPRLQLTLLSKMILLICGLVVLMLILIGVYSNSKYTNTIKEQIGIRALNLAHTVSVIPDIKKAFSEPDPSKIIQPIIREIRFNTDAEFIVVGNHLGIRYSHPIPDRIGEKMVGDDNERALLYGESYISEAVGSLGPSVRGKVPIFSGDGEIIGVVSVGFLIDDIEMTIWSYVKGVWFWLFICILFGIIGAILISLHVKKSIRGLEPDEIVQLFEEREAILQSIHEAIIAVDKKGIVTLYNDAARKIINVNNDQQVIGMHIKEVLPQTRLVEVLETGESQFNQDLWVKEEQFIVNRVPIYNDTKLMGAVSTFRNKTEFERLLKELSNVKQYSDALRVQTHEFSNKLNTISGLLQLEKVPEAIDFITKESRQQQKWIHFLIDSVKDSYVSAILLGKLNQAHELGIEMTIDEDSQLAAILSEKQREGLVTILGNILENAYDAVLEQNDEPTIKIFFTDIGHEIVFEIEDNGQGIAVENIDKIFRKGFTTKEGSHGGIGLPLVQHLLADLGGNLTLENSELGGACFIIAIPKLKGNGGIRDEKNSS